MPFLLPDQQHQSTEGTLIIAKTHKMLNLNKQKNVWQPHLHKKLKTAVNASFCHTQHNKQQI